MRDLSNRIWEGDIEIIYLEFKGYQNILSKLLKFATDFIELNSIHEEWHFSENQTEILISIKYNKTKIETWVKREGDFFNMEVIALLNFQLKLVSYKYYETDNASDGQIYFICEDELNLLKTQIAVHDNFPLNIVAYNTHKQLTLKNDYAYSLMPILTELISNLDNRPSYYIPKLTIDYIIKTIEIIDWERISNEDIKIDLLYDFIKRPI